MSYPQTGVAIDRQTEELLIPMRMYMGAGVIDKQNLIILNDIQGAGFVGGHGSRLCQLNEAFRAPGDEDDDEYSTGHDLMVCVKLENTPWTDLINDPVFRAHEHNRPRESSPFYELINASMGDGIPDEFEANDVPVIPYAGAMWSARAGGMYEKIQSNNGHLEGLDDPRYCDRLEQRQRCHVRQWQGDITVNTGP